MNDDDIIIIQSTDTVVVETADGISVSIASNNTTHSVVTNQTIVDVAPNPEIIYINQGPQGIQGPQGPAGPVSSVGLQMPAEFTVINSPITNAGTIVVNKATGTANLFYATPATGGTPLFRLHVPSDIPFLVGASGAQVTYGASSITITASGIGTVTSVNIAVPTEFSVSGGPVTGSGIITISKNNENANYFWAGPTSGSPAAPTFRLITLADLPNISIAAGGLGRNSPIGVHQFLGSTDGSTYSALTINASTGMALNWQGSTLYLAATGGGGGTITAVNGASGIEAIVNGSTVTLACTSLFQNGVQPVFPANQVVGVSSDGSKYQGYNIAAGTNITVNQSGNNITISSNTTTAGSTGVSYGNFYGTTTLAASSPTLCIFNIPASSYTVTVPYASSCLGQEFILKRDYSVGGYTETQYNTSTSSGIAKFVGANFGALGASCYVTDGTAINTISGPGTVYTSVYNSSLTLVNQLALPTTGIPSAAIMGQCISPDRRYIYMTTSNDSFDFIRLDTTTGTFTSISVGSTYAPNGTPCISPDGTKMVWTGSSNFSLSQSLPSIGSLSNLGGGLGADYSHSNIVCSNIYAAGVDANTGILRVFLISTGANVANFSLPSWSSSNYLAFSNVVIYYDSINDKILVPTSTSKLPAFYVYDLKSLGYWGSSIESPNYVQNLMIDPNGAFYYGINPLSGALYRFSANRSAYGTYNYIDTIDTKSNLGRIGDILTVGASTYMSNYGFNGTNIGIEIGIPNPNQTVTFNIPDALDNSTNSFTLQNPEDSLTIIAASGGTRSGWKIVSETSYIPEPANYFLAGPASGSPTAPSYRLIMSNDITFGTVPASTTSANYVYAGPDNTSGLPSFRKAVPNDIPFIIGASGIQTTYNDPNNITVSATGLLSNVSVSMPAEFNVSTVTNNYNSTETITVTKATESANTAWMGPTSGAAAQPSFRSIVGSDLFNVQGASGIHTSVSGNTLLVTCTSLFSGPDTPSISGNQLVGANAAGTAYQGWNIVAGQNMSVGQTGNNITLNAIASGAQILYNGFCQARLTAASGTPVPTSDQTAVTSIYCTPVGGNIIGLYDGSSSWYAARLLSDISLAVGTLTIDCNYDIFAYNSGTVNNPTLALCASSWYAITASNTTLAAGSNVVISVSNTSNFNVGDLVTISGQACNEYATPTSTSGPRGICSGPDGRVWYTEGAFGFGHIVAITTTGTQTQYNTTTGVNAEPDQICSDGTNLWFTEIGTHKVAKMTTSGTCTEFSVPNASSGLTAGICFDGTNLWFPEGLVAQGLGTQDKLVKCTTSGTMTEFNPFASSTQCNGICFGAGYLWITTQNNTILKTSTAGTLVSTYTIPTPSSVPKGICLGPDGNIWFCESGVNKVGMLNITSGTITEYTVSAGAFYICSDGTYLWVSGGNSITRLSTSGTVLSGSTPTASSGTWGICIGPDSNVWFTENTASKVASTFLPFGESETITAISANTSITVGTLANGYTSGLPIQITSGRVRTTNLQLQNGVYVSGDDTKLRYLGTIRLTSVPGQTEDSAARRFIWNYYQRKLRHFFAQVPVASWSTAVTTFRTPDGNTTDGQGQVSFVVGVAEDSFTGIYNVQWANSSVGGLGLVGAMLNGPSGTVTPTQEMGTTSTSRNIAAPVITGYPLIGLNTASGAEKSSTGADAQTFNGTNTNGVNSWFDGWILM